jgi:Transglutaminase-like superfamily/TgpA N-terminal domain
MSAEEPSTAFAQATRHWREVAALVVIGALPGLVLANIVDRRYGVPIAAAAAALAALIATTTDAMLGGRGRRRVLQALTGAIGSACVAVGVAAIAPAADLAGTNPVTAAIDAVTHGWSAIVTSPVPADAAPRILVPLALLAFGATGAATWITLRTKSPVASLLPGLTALVMASVAAGRHQFAPLLVGAVMVVAAGAFLAARRPDQQHSGEASLAGRVSVRPELWLSVAIVAAAVALGAGAGPTLAFGRDDKPFDPREHLVPPFVPSGAVNPLDLIATRHQNPDQQMFTVATDEPIFTRLIALETYDGARWTTAGAYQRSGSVVTAPTRSNVDTRSTRSRITVSGLTGPWMPSTGDATRVTGVGLLIDPASGSLVASSGDAAGAAYTIDANISLPDLTVLPTTGTATDVPAATTVPNGLPIPLRQMAEVATAGATQPLAKAVLLERYLHLNFTIDDKFPGGQSYGHLVKALTENRAGTEEQFAIAFAVLGRVVGLPTRVVVGFAPGTPTATGVYDVRSKDARVWPEVKFENVGWVAFDPAPARDGQSGRASVGVGGSQGIAVRQGGKSARPIGGDPQAASPTPPTPAPSSNGSSLWQQIAVITAATLAVVLIAGPLLIVIVKRRRTTRLRRQGGPRQQVLGAWHDVLDRLVEIGVANPQQQTVEELVEHSEPMTSALAGMFRPVSRTLYDDSEPAEGDPAQAWRARDRFVKATRKNTSILWRVRWAVDPRPIVARHPRRTKQ